MIGKEYWENLSLPEFLKALVVCQNRYKEGKPCEECSHYKKGRCDGVRDIKENADIFYDTPDKV